MAEKFTVLTIVLNTYPTHVGVIGQTVSKNEKSEPRFAFLFVFVYSKVLLMVNMIYNGYPNTEK